MTPAQLQQVVVTRAADRHASAHERAFAESHEVVVPARSRLQLTLNAALLQLPTLPPGEYVITVSEPYDP